mgnify:CR=1 FL=1
MTWKICYKKFQLRTYTLLLSKAYLISPTNSLTFPKNNKCSAAKQNFKSFTTLLHNIFAIHIQNSYNANNFLQENM